MPVPEKVRSIGLSLADEVLSLVDCIRKNHYAVLQLDDDPAREITLRLESLASTLRSELLSKK